MKLKFTLLYILLTLSLHQIYAQCGCTNCPVDLPDDLNTTFTASINVQNTSNNTLGVNNELQQVCLNITHDWIGDLDITLIAPDGTEVVLFADGNSDSSMGGNEGSPFGNSSDDMVVCFTIPSMSAPNVFGTTGTGSCNSPNYSDPCNGTTPCYTGNWGTWDEGCDGGNGLDEFNNGTGTVSGVWTIEINDNAGANQGTLNDVTLVFATEPDNCESTCPADAGTTTNNMGTNNVFLCYDATLNVTSDNNYTLPNPASSDPVGLAYAVYNCAPTTSEPATDPCFTGWYIINEDFNETNTAGNTYYDYIVANPSPDENANGSPTGNDLYFVPITFDDYCDDIL
ncbi:MAG: proprotein convertase P-domain-containing protein, partial [Bacteroidetes bacterium]|nr:proprotein convertase P-domain-containing protein [Bacteroidota bacterium]